MSVPYLARDAPIAEILDPVVVDAFETLGEDGYLAVAHRFVIGEVMFDAAHHLRRPLNEFQFHTEAVGVVKKFLGHAERQDDVARAVGARLRGDAPASDRPAQPDRVDDLRRMAA